MKNAIDVEMLIDMLKPLQEVVVWFIKLGIDQRSSIMVDQWYQYLAVKCEGNTLVINLTKMDTMPVAFTDQLRAEIEKAIDPQTGCGCNSKNGCKVLIKLDAGSDLYRIYGATTITIGTNLFLFFSDETKV